MTLIGAIREFFGAAGEEPVHVQDLYAHLPGRLRHSIRSQIYRNLGKQFQRVGRGLYVMVARDAACVVVHGDALEEVSKLPSDSIDAAITDPPYAWQDEANADGTTPKMHLNFERAEIDATLALELWRVLKEGAHVFVFVPAETSATRPKINELLRTLEAAGFTFNKRWIWYKGRMGMGYNGRCSHEAILFLSKGRRRMPCDLRVKDVLHIPPVHPRRKLHPAEKPAGLLEALVRFATRIGETILDFYAGSCATGLAALSLGRNAVLVEKDFRFLALRGMDQA